MSVRDVSGMTSLSAWYLADRNAPRKVGTVSLIPGTTKCSFLYEDGWRETGFSLSPDMPLGRRGDKTPIRPVIGSDAPGALDDAMPDRWGQRMIRAVDRPKRATALDFLYHAGDRRFGALGISSDPDAYSPYPENPLLTPDSMEEAGAIIQRIIDRQPLNELERRMIESGRSMGGAQPKMLVSIAGEEWLAKFPNGSNVDYQLVEHASMVLAREIGIRTVDSRVHAMPPNHVVLTKRFDRDGGRRLHALSARTLLLSEGGESYAAIANVIRERCDPKRVAEQRRELFARMVFNILMDNTDDHTKNHAFILGADGHYEMAPAFDIPPQMNGIGMQAIPVSGGESSWDVDTAVAHGAKFGLNRDEAVEAWHQVAAGVSRWKEVFSGVGVLGIDIDYLSDFLDSDEKLSLRGMG